MANTDLLIVLVCIILILSTYSFILSKKIKQVNKSKLIYQGIVHALQESIFVLDSNKYIVAIYNITSAAMERYAINEMIGKHLSVFVQDKSSPFHQACLMLNDSFDRIVFTHQDEHFQYMVENVHLEATTKLLPNGYVISMVRDITFIVGKENEIMQKKQNELSAALSAGGITSWSFDVASNTFSSIHDNNVIGQKTTYEELLDKIHDSSDKELVKRSIAKLISKESKHCEFFVRVINNLNKMQWSHVHAVPHEYDQSGNVKVIIGSQKDVTIDIETRNELIRLRDKAEESNRLKTAFIANMSHEIRTPLNAIVGFSNLISTATNKEESDLYMQVIRQNNDLLLNIINDILDLSKIESGKIDFVFRKINVLQLLQQLKQSTDLKVKSGVQVIVDPINENMVLKSDANRLSQVITNFLSNAVKFTSEGSIHLGCRAEDENFYFYVKDTGSGISKENLSTVFERFVKLDRFIQGTGLGLSICETIIRLLGGTIGVDSELGVGSTFWFTIPALIMEEERKHEENTVKEEEEKWVVPLGTGNKILVAEDNPSNYLLYEKILHNYELIHAWNGLEAVELFKKEKPVLIFMDIRMPKMNGYEATSAIRKLSKDIPIIAVTASVLQQEQKSALANGFTGFIAKPIIISQLRDTVKKYLSI